MQLRPSLEQFENPNKLFQKSKREATTSSTFFFLFKVLKKEEWITKKNIWFERYVIGVPSTNNHKTTFAHIKCEGTTLGPLFKQCCWKFAIVRLKYKWQEGESSGKWTRLPMETWLKKMYQLINNKQQNSMGILLKESTTQWQSWFWLLTDARIMTPSWKVEVKRPMENKLQYMYNNFEKKLPESLLLRKCWRTRQEKKLSLLDKKKQGRTRKAMSDVLVN